MRARAGQAVLERQRVMRPNAPGIQPAQYRGYCGPHVLGMQPTEHRGYCGLYMLGMQPAQQRAQWPYALGMQLAQQEGQYGHTRRACSSRNRRGTTAIHAGHAARATKGHYGHTEGTTAIRAGHVACATEGTAAIRARHTARATQGALRPQALGMQPTRQRGTMAKDNQRPFSKSMELHKAAPREEGHGCTNRDRTTARKRSQ